MPCSEIVTIQLGPYANYVGSFLWNQDYVHAFGRAKKERAVDLNNYEVRSYVEEQEEHDVEAADPGVFFRKRRINKHGGVPFIPRAVFCDFAGGLPTSLTSKLASKVAESARDNSQGTGQSWAGSWAVQQQQQTQHQEDEEERFHPAWYAQLQPALRPQAQESRLCCFLPTGQLGGETSSFAYGAVLAQALTESGDPFLECILESVRWHAEDMAAVGGFRILCDADSAWAGLAALLVTALTEEYCGAPIAVFGVAPPIDLETSPQSPWAAMITAHPHDPATPASYAALEGPKTGVLECKKGTLEIRTPAFLGVTSAQQAKNVHLTRATSLAMLVTALSEHDSVVLVPQSVPNQLEVQSRLMSSAMLEASRNAAPNARELLETLSTAFPAYAFGVTSAPMLATLVHTALSPVYTSGAAMHLSELQSILKPIPKLFISSTRGRILDSSQDVLFKNAVSQEDETDDRFYTSQHVGALQLSNFSSLCAPCAPAILEYIIETPENLSTVYSPQQPAEDMRKYSSVTILRGLGSICPEEGRDELRSQFTRQCVENRGIFARHSVSQPMDVPVTLPRMTPFANLAISTKTQLKNTYVNVLSRPIDLCAAVELYAGSDVSYGLQQLKYRLKDGKKNALFMHSYNEQNFTREDLDDALNTLDVLFDEYMTEK